MPQREFGGQPGGHDHDAAAPLGHGSNDAFELTDHGVTIRYTHSHLKLIWENGTQLTLRTRGCQASAQVDYLAIGDFVALTVEAQVEVRDPGLSQVKIALGFPRTFEADLRSLADRLNAEQAEGYAADEKDPGSAPGPSSLSGRPQSVPGHEARPLDPGPRPARRPEPARRTEAGGAAASNRPVPSDSDRAGHMNRAGHSVHPQPADLPFITFKANLAAWAADDDWLGLYPTAETSRLIADRPVRHSDGASAPPSQ